MSSTCLIHRRPGQTQLLHKSFEALSIEPYKKSILQDRYVRVLDNFHHRANVYSFMFFTTRLTITVGSILVPAFLSIQGDPIRNTVYLVAWAISILVTICNGIITLFKIDKKYYFIHMTLELLHSEGWQYIGLTGRYASKDIAIPSTHENQFLIFFHMAEKIKLRQVEEEYWKFTDISINGATSVPRPMDSIHTPITQQGPLASLPNEQKNVIEGWISDMNKKSARGLEPRKLSMTLDYSRVNKLYPTVDGASPTKLPRTSSGFSMPMLPIVPKTPSPRATVVQPPHVSVSIGREEESSKDEAIYAV